MKRPTELIEKAKGFKSTDQFAYWLSMRLVWSRHAKRLVMRLIILMGFGLMRVAT